VSADNGLGPCDCFTVLESSKSPDVSQCEVCDHIQAEHAGTGIRVLTGGEIEALRRRILIERYERRQRERPRKADPSAEVRTNGDPELH
jgi:hypothetical protein